ncbi:D-alanyl-D-alanine dipeptidase [Tenacibaculum sp. MAR_2009_124]|uniref:M15 family metallopeptidase n=1 Tax=Tenacibaculum sp. MAR_2009_124 TaxID=1250059 RepID=UPI0008995726|nr:M15 family metallopeptidase [Tenacibaculum sp. MAR_2009_124]SEB35923.1 D-alanyl-D-alanine dipeptidase [Tenacibaculum sp. MAR_2009_124]
MKAKTLTTITFLFFTFITWSQLPKGFSYIRDIAPSIQRELRYCNHNNFVGTPIDGYFDDVLITSTLTAKALKKVQNELVKKGYSLKIFDAYRPQQAVNHFVRWARVMNDTLMKSEYYPKINKRHLFKLGYIASKSGHSRGSSVDLTMVDLKTNEELDMGSPFDFFGKSSHIAFEKLTPQQKKNRSILQKTMVKHGFRPYKNEWWHFTLRNEPFPKTFFNFPIK